MPTLEDFKGKKYKTLDGYDAEIVYVLDYSEYPVLVVVPETCRAIWLNQDLKGWSTDIAPYIHEVTPYDDWPVGCWIVVSDFEDLPVEKRLVRKFNGVDENGSIKSFTPNGTDITWKHAKRILD